MFMCRIIKLARYTCLFIRLQSLPGVADPKNSRLSLDVRNLMFHRKMWYSVKASGGTWTVFCDICDGLSRQYPWRMIAAPSSCCRPKVEHVVGPGGDTIRELVDTTGAEINISRLGPKATGGFFALNMPMLCLKTLLVLAGSIAFWWSYAYFFGVQEVSYPAPIKGMHFFWVCGFMFGQCSMHMDIIQHFRMCLYLMSSKILKQNGPWKIWGQQVHLESFRVGTQFVHSVLVCHVWCFYNIPRDDLAF